MDKTKGIKVHSEIGKLKKVLVHTPGEEISNIAPDRLDELLFSAVLEPKNTISEHKDFVKKLENEGVEVVQVVDLVAETYDLATAQDKDDFINDWISEIEPVIKSKAIEKKIKEYILSFKKTKDMVRKMISGIFADEIGIKSKNELIADPIPNLFFTRDPFASVGDGVTIHKMKYVTRRRETVFCRFIFKVNPEYNNVPQYYSTDDKGTVEGGDIFIYGEDSLVIGVSERTQMKSIQVIAEKVKASNESFKKIYAINVPKMKNLMHLDTWLTMIDYDKFIYSPNMLKSLKIWIVDLTKSDFEAEELNMGLEEFLTMVTGKKPVLIPVGGYSARKIDIDIETHFDATNYLVIRPGVVIGYDRNQKTTQALIDAGVTVIPFKGNQLSLGMGSARCMSMPLVREKI